MIQQTITCDACGKPASNLPAIIARGQVLHACSLRCSAKLFRQCADKADAEADAEEKRAAEDQAKAAADKAKAEAEKQAQQGQASATATAGKG